MKCGQTAANFTIFVCFFITHTKCCLTQQNAAAAASPVHIQVSPRQRSDTKSQNFSMKNYIRHKAIKTSQKHKKFKSLTLETWLMSALNILFCHRVKRPYQKIRSFLLSSCVLKCSISLGAYITYQTLLIRPFCIITHYVAL